MKGHSWQVEGKASSALRVRALLLDVLLLGGVSMFLGLWGALSDTPTLAAFVSAKRSALLFAIYSAGALCLLSLPYTFLEVVFLGTPGKLATGLRLRQDDGSPARLTGVLWRWLLKNTPLLIWAAAFCMRPFLCLSSAERFTLLASLILVGGGHTIWRGRSFLDWLTRTHVYRNPGHVKSQQAHAHRVHTEL